MLAEAVAHPTDPHVRQLDADNRNAGRLPGIAEAVATEAAYMVNVAPDVLALDVDTATDRAAALDLAADLRDAGWPVMRVNSGRAHHLHVWAVIPDHDDLDRAKGKARAIGLLPRLAMRPPGAPHRHGLPVTLLDDPGRFTAEVEAARMAEATDRADPDRDRYDWRLILTTGKLPPSLPVPPGCGAGWWRVFWCAVGAAREGLTVNALRAELADPRNRGAYGYRDRLNRRRKSHADYWLDHYVWPKATESARKRPATPADATEARQHLDDLRAAVEAARWPGIAGATDRAVLLAILDRAHHRGSMTPSMSHREIAEAARCHRNTASTSTRRLRAAGWLLVAGEGRGITELGDDGTYREMARATRWRLRVPEDRRARACDTEGTPPARPSLNGTRARALADVGRWRGIGPNGVRVLDALADGPMSPRELAEALSLNRGNLRARLLPRLAAHGLLTREGDAYALVEDLDAALVATAEALDLDGKAAEVAERHAQERAGYLDHRERTRPDRETARRRSISARAKRAPASEPVPLPIAEPTEAPDPPLPGSRTPPPPPAGPPWPVEAVDRLTEDHETSLEKVPA